MGNKQEVLESKGIFDNEGYTVVIRQTKTNDKEYKDMCDRMFKLMCNPRYTVYNKQFANIRKDDTIINYEITNKYITKLVEIRNAKANDVITEYNRHIAHTDKPKSEEYAKSIIILRDLIHKFMINKYKSILEVDSYVDMIEDRHYGNKITDEPFDYDCFETYTELFTSDDRDQFNSIWDSINDYDVRGVTDALKSLFGYGCLLSRFIEISHIPKGIQNVHKFIKYIEFNSFTFTEHTFFSKLGGKSRSGRKSARTRSRSRSKQRARSRSKSKQKPKK